MAINKKGSLYGEMHEINLRHANQPAYEKVTEVTLELA